MNNLGELFRQIRSSKNWSIREAALRMGISFSHLSILERGIDPRTGKGSNPKPDTLRIISKAYDYPYEELLKSAGYLNDDTSSDMKFDLTVFISNINLIMGEMNIDELSDDIHEKTGYTISSKQIRSYISGDIEPFPGTMNILSTYVGVSPDFWYCFNTVDTLESKKRLYTEKFIKNSSVQFNKEYNFFSHLPTDIKDWIVNEESVPYLKIAFESHKNNISPNTIKLVIDTILGERNKDTD